uniref:Uncharacterized protein n=1 Tax=Anguilla anguilla TaxID=7936 RepID=A0A0E9RMI7_ANGAN
MLCEVILYYSLSLIKLSRCKIISWLNDCTVRPRFWGWGHPGVAAHGKWTVHLPLCFQLGGILNRTLDWLS